MHIAKEIRLESPQLYCTGCPCENDAIAWCQLYDKPINEVSWYDDYDLMIHHERLAICREENGL